MKQKAKAFAPKPYDPSSSHPSNSFAPLFLNDGDRATEMSSPHITLPVLPPQESPLPPHLQFYEVESCDAAIVVAPKRPTSEVSHDGLTPWRGPFNPLLLSSHYPRCSACSYPEPSASRIRAPSPSWHRPRPGGSRLPKRNMESASPGCLQHAPRSSQASLPGPPRSTSQPLLQSYLPLPSSAGAVSGRGPGAHPARWPTRGFAAESRDL